nr:hypothetical protein GCM10020092_035510 [Actinoplanes digitatis]
MRAVHGDHEAALVEFARADAGFAVVGKSADQARTAVFAARSLG